MSAIDIVILIFTILLVISIIFFSYILPIIKGDTKRTCPSCPAVKRSKRLLKKYIKNRKKADKTVK